MAEPLSLDDFPAFVESIHGYEPFGWQRDLLAQVHGDRAWPELVDVPTGAGKTAALDIALFALALDVAQEPAQRWAPRRVVMVVDRRIVVDQTARRARAIVTALAGSPRHPVLAAVAAALSTLSVQGTPALATTLRGGLVTDASWCQWPDVPTLISSTVDQVGSRLLFRGYGVSDGMRPIHAGLVGNDALILLDEVHLSQPFAQTLRALRDRYQRQAQVVVPHRWDVCELSATPGVSPPRTFVVDLGRLPNSGPDAALTRRIRASKPTRLRVAEARRGDVRSPTVAAAVSEVRAVLEHEHVRRIGVVVNRVASAQQVAADLRAGLAGDGVTGVDVRVLTGRMRPLDRDDRVQSLQERLASGTPRSADSPRTVLVATQCIEAGADLDLDALVTECASLDALRQRFGRVDRLGELTAQDTPSVNVVIGARPQIDPGHEDPVYGEALSRTWAWLVEQADLDFGIAALSLPADDQLRSLLAARAHAPHLRPGDLDRWVQTYPVPRPDPDPALWLHGLGAEQTEVSVVWRADLSEDLLSAPSQAGLTVEQSAEALDVVRRIVAACAPHSAEAVTVPLAAARRWLAGGGTTPIADVDGAEVPADGDVPDEARPCLRWRGDDSVVLRTPGTLRPGDTVVVPSAYGGYGEGGWTPESKIAVPDLSHRTEVEQRRRVTLRLAPALWGFPSPPQPPEHDDASLEERRAAILQWLSADPAPEDGTTWPGWWRPAADWLLRTGFRFSVQNLPAPTYVVVGPRPLPARLTTADGLPDAGAETVDSEPDTSALTGVQTSLDKHLVGVGALAGQLARHCRLGDALSADIALAGRLHDLGKSDPRFQLMLHGGDRVKAAMADRALAKSGLPANDRRARRFAQEASGYPRGTRHELGSIDMIERSAELRAQAHDWDLVLHLVASHHGFGRPFVPVVIDEEPQPLVHSVGDIDLLGSSGHSLAALDSGVADRFWRMVRRYGWYRLAWFEAILRLADHRCSQQEQLDGGSDDA